jgi:hypothetical protein
MPEYEMVKKLGSYDNFKGLNQREIAGHKLFARNKLSAPTVTDQNLNITKK